jgi:hypothetical protein
MAKSNDFRGNIPQKTAMSMNIGAKGSNTHKFDKQAMIKDAKSGSIQECQDMIIRDIEQCTEWIDERSNNSDFETNKKDMKDKIAKLFDAITCKSEIRAIEASIAILETQKHPTASDIVDSPCKNAIYNICGKRAYNYKE